MDTRQPGDLTEGSMVNCYKAFIDRSPWKKSEFPNYGIWITSDADDARNFRQGWAARCDTIKQQTQEEMNDFEFNIPDVTDARKAIDEVNKDSVAAQAKDVEKLISDAMKRGVREVGMRGVLHPPIKAILKAKGYKYDSSTNEYGMPHWRILIGE